MWFGFAILDPCKTNSRKVQLIDASGFWQKMRKSLGSKRKELSDEHIEEITRLFGSFLEKNDGKKPRGGRPDVSAVAGELGLSDRTLQRRIDDDGTTFRRLLLEARQELAREYLNRPDIDVAEVAYLLGYED